MSILNLAQHLETAGLGTRGQTIFIGEGPPEKKVAVILRDFGGAIDFELTGVRRLSVQIAVRDTDYAAGKTKAEAVNSALSIRHTAIGAAYFYEVVPRHEPIAFGREEMAFYTFVLNIDAVWRAN